jgi:hypothetical protein
VLRFPFRPPFDYRKEVFRKGSSPQNMVAFLPPYKIYN